MNVNEESKNNEVSCVYKTLGVVCILVSAFGMLEMNTNIVFACSCVPLPPPIEHFKKATAVFSGKVIEIKKAKLNIGNGMFLQKRVKFDVAKSWKGVEKKTVLLFTGRGGGDCGYGFEKGESYLVYAFGKDSLSTSICTRTRTLANAQEDLKALERLPVQPLGKLRTTWANIKLFVR